PVTGVVTVAAGADLDHEASQSHAITIVATSAGALVASARFEIAVADVNEAPLAPLDVNPAANTVSELGGAGTPAGITTQATDPDLGDTVPYGLADDGDGAFVIDPQSGVVILAEGAALVNEETPTIGIVVRASDGAGLFQDIAVTIHVVDVFIDGTSGDDQ